jgi:hypothetical protein
VRWKENFLFNKVFSGYQSCQFVKNHQRFRDHVVTIIALTMGTETIPETLEVFDELTQWVTLKKKVKQSLYTPWRRLGGEEV